MPKGTWAMQLLSPTTGHHSFRRLVWPHLLPLLCWPVVESGTPMSTQSQDLWNRQRKTHSCSRVAAQSSFRGMPFPDRRAEETERLLRRLLEMRARLLQHQ